MAVNMRCGDARHLRYAPGPQRGFTYLAVLVAMLMLSLGTQKVMNVVSVQAQREREAELLRIGQQYAQAVGAYYESTPGAVKRWPRKLDDLVEDRRFVTIKRYLREVYPDPMTRLTDWTLITTADGGIAGVASRSEARPLRGNHVSMEGVTLSAASRYADWQFIYQPMNTIPAPSTVKGVEK